MKLLWCRQTWAFIVGMAASSPVWWFYIFWGPKFLHKNFHSDLGASSLPLALILPGPALAALAAGGCRRR